MRLAILALLLAACGLPGADNTHHDNAPFGEYGATSMCTDIAPVDCRIVVDGFTTRARTSTLFISCATGRTTATIAWLTSDEAVGEMRGDICNGAALFVTRKNNGVPIVLPPKGALH